jgi:hypothetical protein
MNSQHHSRGEVSIDSNQNFEHGQNYNGTDQPVISSFATFGSLIE